MSGPRPGEIRCPTCHRSTPPAAFCTNCGSPIPSGARVRPRGLDRDELQARIRARRSGQPYLRRGGVVMPGGEGAFEPYEPEAGDELHRARTAAPEGPRRVAAGLRAREADARVATHDQQTDGRDASRAGPDGADDEDPSHRPFLPPERRGAGEAYPTAYAGDEGERADAGEPERYADAYPGYDDPYAAYAGPYYAPPSPRTSSGAGPFLIVGFLALGVLALLAGGALAFLTGGDEAPQDAGIAGAPTATASATGTPEEPTPTAAAPTTTAGVSGSTPSPTANPSASVVFPDGFRAQAQPCRGEPANGRCPASGAVVSPAEGQVWILVTFEAVKTGDLIAVSGTGADGRGIGDASWPATGNGSGYSYFAFALPGLQPGEYQVEVTRNGQHAATTIFRVEG